HFSSLSTLGTCNLFDNVVLGVFFTSENQFAQKSSKEKLASQNHRSQRNKKFWPFRNKSSRGIYKKFVNSQIECQKETNKKHCRAPSAKKMHRPFTKSGKEPNGNQIQ